MKKSFAALIAAIIVMVSMTMQVKAQAFEAVYADTTGNSKTKVVEVEFENNLDSIVVSLFAEGEIDLDSLDVKLGTNYFARYKGYRTAFSHYASTNTTYSQTLTVNLDSAVTSYSAKVTTIPKSALIGYNKLKLSVISASSGNDATDPRQKLVLFVHKF